MIVKQTDVGSDVPVDIFRELNMMNYWKGQGVLWKILKKPAKRIGSSTYENAEAIWTYQMQLYDVMNYMLFFTDKNCTIWKAMYERNTFLQHELCSFSLLCKVGHEESLQHQCSSEFLALLEVHHHAQRLPNVYLIEYQKKKKKNCNN